MVAWQNTLISLEKDSVLIGVEGEETPRVLKLK
jgi:hypothetical protein